MSNTDNSSCSSASVLSLVRNGQAHQGVCQFDTLPNELVMGIMHYMDEKSLRQLVLTSTRMCDVWTGSKLAILAGMQAAQFEEFSGAFGKPGRRTVQQLRAVEFGMVSVNVKHRRLAPESQEQRVEDLWWTHFELIRTLQGTLDRETVDVCALPGAKRFGTGLTRRALLLNFVVVSKIVQIINGDAIHSELPTEKFRSVIQTISDQPRQVQSRFLDLVGYLGNKFVPRALVEPFAMKLKSLEPEDVEYKRLQQWLSQRILALGISVIIDRHLPFCSMIKTGAAATNTRCLLQDFQFFLDERTEGQLHLRIAMMLGCAMEPALGVVHDRSFWEEAWMEADLI